MPGAHYFVFKNLRPPVVIDEKGQAPLKFSKKFKSSEKVSPVDIIANLTDAGQLVPKTWSDKHHIKPSLFNC